MADTTAKEAPEDTMATLNAAKHHLRAAMRHKLHPIPHASILSQSTPAP